MHVCIFHVFTAEGAVVVVVVCSYTTWLQRSSYRRCHHLDKRQKYSGPLCSNDNNTNTAKRNAVSNQRVLTARTAPANLRQMRGRLAAARDHRLNIHHKCRQFFVRSSIRRGLQLREEFELLFRKKKLDVLVVVYLDKPVCSRVTARNCSSPRGTSFLIPIFSLNCIRITR